VGSDPPYNSHMKKILLSLILLGLTLTSAFANETNWNEIQKEIVTIVELHSYEPNELSTWKEIKEDVTEYLNDLWLDGQMPGDTVKDFRKVHVGLGESMTEEDMANNVLRIKVSVALKEPNNFTEFTHTQVQKP
jgi:phage tail sheath protein FI